jgi:hypothetical protein
MSGNAAARTSKAWMALPSDAGLNDLAQASRLAERHHR